MDPDMITEHDPILRELAQLPAGDRSRGALLVTGLRFINYRAQRYAGATAAELADIYPRAQAFERMFAEGL